MKYAVLILFVIFSKLTHAAVADVEKTMTDLFGESQPYMSVFNAFQQAIVQGDKEKVATLIDYPITIRINSKKLRVSSAKIFLKNYDRIFTKNIINVVKNQKAEDLFVRDQGVMIGNGEVWFSGICIDKECKKVDVKIDAINQI